MLDVRRIAKNMEQWTHDWTCPGCHKYICKNSGKSVGVKRALAKATRRAFKREIKEQFMHDEVP